jgi:hypothetical protein
MYNNSKFKKTFIYEFTTAWNELFIFQLLYLIRYNIKHINAWLGLNGAMLVYWWLHTCDIIWFKFSILFISNENYENISKKSWGRCMSKTHFRGAVKY